MSLETGFSVRLPPALRSRLAAVSARTALKQSDLVRMAVESYVAQAEASGQIQVPILQETPCPSPAPPERKTVTYTKKPRQARPRALQDPKPPRVCAVSQNCPESCPILSTFDHRSAPIQSVRATPQA